MKRLLAVAALPAMLIALTGCVQTAQDIKLARTAVDAFHQKMNAADFDAIYAEADDAFRESVPAAQINQVLSRVHNAVGTHKQSSQTAFEVNYKNGANLVKVTFKSEFEKRTINEIFEFRIRDGKARLLNYESKERS
jgi:hypothetical protein